MSCLDRRSPSLSATTARMVGLTLLTSPEGCTEVMKTLRLEPPPRLACLPLPGPLRLLRLPMRFQLLRGSQCSEKTKSRASDASPTNLGDASLTRLLLRGGPAVSGPGASVTPGQRVRDAAQQALVLSLLPVPLPLCLPGLFFRLAGLCLLCRLLLGVSFSLLRPALFLLGLVAGQGAVGFLGLAFGLVVHSCSFPSTLYRVRNYCWFAALCTSLTVMRPSAPEPCSWERSTPICWAFCWAACVAFGCCGCWPPPDCWAACPAACCPCWAACPAVSCACWAAPLAASWAWPATCPAWSVAWPATSCACPATCPT